MLNRVMLIGNLGADPELKTTQSGLPFCRLSVAVSDPFTDKNTQQKVERTVWVSVLTYDRLAENCSRFLTKGSQVFVEGKLQQDQYVDQQSGQKVHKTYVRALSVQFLSRSQRQQEGVETTYQQRPQQQQNQYRQQRTQPQQVVSGGVEEVPF